MKECKNHQFLKFLNKILLQSIFACVFVCGYMCLYASIPVEAKDQCYMIFQLLFTLFFDAVSLI